MQLCRHATRWCLLGTVAAIPQESVLDNKSRNVAQDVNDRLYLNASVNTYESSHTSTDAYIDDLQVFSNRATYIPSTKTGCETSCTVYAPKISVVSWVPEDKIIYTANVTVGIITTLVFLCDNTVVATRTQTEYHWNAAPAGMYPPYSTTNDHGNALAIAPFTDTSVTSVVELVYPNSHIAYGNQFSWEGVIDMSLYDGNPGVCATATSELSTTHLESHRPFSRDDYLQPTATRTNGSDTSGRGYQPLWVLLDSQPPESFFTHLRIVFYSLMQEIHTYGAWLGCDITASVSPTPSMFREPRYLFEHRTMSVGLNVPAARNNMTPAGIWRNNTGSGALCMDFTPLLAGLCEKPEIATTSGECVRTSTIWDDTLPTHLSYTNFEGDRSGFFTRSSFTPQSATGFETAYNTEDTVTIFIIPTQDWNLDGYGGIITAPEALMTPTNRNPDASEAAAIAEYFQGRADERVGSWSRPQKTQPPSETKGLELIKSESVSRYFREPPGGDSYPVSITKAASTIFGPQTLSGTDEAVGLYAIGSALNRIFFQKTTKSWLHAEISLIGADHDRPQTVPLIAMNIVTPAFRAEQAVHATADGLAGATPTTSWEHLYIQVSTTINNVPTAVGGYILSMTSTVMAGQQIAVDGQATQLPVPDLLPLFISTMDSGVPTSTIGYIVSGRSVATVGQTVVLDGSPIVLVTPDTVFVEFSATGTNGISKKTSAYIISGLLTASIGQRVTLNGTPTVLAAPDLVPTYITTTAASDTERSGLAYIVTGSMTATIGQTVTVEGRTTVLTEPTNQPGVAEGGTRRNRGTCFNVVLLGIGAAFAAWL